MEFLWLLFLVVGAILIGAIGLRLQLSEEEHNEELEVEAHLKEQQDSLKAVLAKKKKPGKAGSGSGKRASQKK